MYWCVILAILSLAKIIAKFVEISLNNFPLYFDTCLFCSIQNYFSSNANKKHHFAFNTFCNFLFFSYHHVTLPQNNTLTIKQWHLYFHITVPRILLLSCGRPTLEQFKTRIKSIRKIITLTHSAQINYTIRACNGLVSLIFMTFVR